MKLASPWVISKVKPDGIPSAKNDDQQILEIELDLNRTAFNDIHVNYQDDSKKNSLLNHKFEFIRHKVDYCSNQIRLMVPVRKLPN